MTFVMVLVISVPYFVVMGKRKKPHAHPNNFTIAEKSLLSMQVSFQFLQSSTAYPL